MLTFVAVLLTSLSANAFTCPDAAVNQSQQFRSKPNPSACYLLSLSGKVAELQAAKSKINQLQAPHCSGTRSATDCYQKYVRSRPAGSSSEAVLLSTLAVGAALKDKEARRVDPQLLELKMLESVLLTFEVTSPSKFRVQQYRGSTPAEMAEIDGLIKVDRETWAEGKRKMLNMLATNLTSVYQKIQSGRVPVSVPHLYNDLLKRHANLLAQPD